MEVAVENARHVWCEGKHGEDVVHVEFVYTQRDVLQGIDVLVVGIYLETSTVGSFQFQICRHTAAVGQENVVTLVYVERLIAQHGIIANERYPYAVLLHVRSQAGRQSEPVFPVVQFRFESRTAFCQRTVNDGIEDIIGVVFVVFYLQPVCYIVFVGIDVEFSFINAYVVDVYSVGIDKSVETADRRRCEIDIHPVVFHTEPSEQSCEDVFFSGIKKNPCFG